MRARGSRRTVCWAKSQMTMRDPTTHTLADSGGTRSGGMMEA